MVNLLGNIRREVITAMLQWPKRAQLSAVRAMDKHIVIFSLN